MSVDARVEAAFLYGGFAPGGYLCRCKTCGAQFQGDKRAYWCESCARQEKTAADAATGEPHRVTDDMVRGMARAIGHCRGDEEPTSLDIQAAKDAAAYMEATGAINVQAARIATLDAALASLASAGEALIGDTGPQPIGVVIDRAGGPDEKQPDDVCEANARLIEAAPAMLKALTAAYHALKSYEHDNASTELAAEVAQFCRETLDKAKVQP